MTKFSSPNANQIANETEVVLHLCVPIAGSKPFLISYYGFRSGIMMLSPYLWKVHTVKHLETVNLMFKFTLVRKEEKKEKY